MRYTSQRATVWSAVSPRGFTVARVVAIAGGLAAVCAMPPATRADAAAPAPARWVDAITVKGYVQFDASLPGGLSRFGGASNFRIRRARPSLAIRIDPRTTAKVQMDLSTGKSGSGASTGIIGDTYVERTIPGFGYVRVGQTLWPVGHELHEDNSALRSPLEMSLPGDMIALGELDTGVLIGSGPAEDQRVHWEAGVFNGQGLRTSDANPNKTLAGRIAWRITPMVRAGVSGIAGSYRNTTLAGGPQTFRHDVLDAEFQIHATRALSLEGELYNCLSIDPASGPVRHARFTGGYLLFETWIGPLRSVPFLRYQRTYGDLDYRSWDVGWLYHLSSTQRLTAQVDIVRAAHSSHFGVRWQVNF